MSGYVYGGKKKDTDKQVTEKMRASNKGKMSRRRERLAAFKDLRDGGRSVEEAAAVLGVHPSTGWRYELETRDGGGEAP